MVGSKHGTILFTWWRGSIADQSNFKILGRDDYEDVCKKFDF